ncbi:MULTISPECIES: GNAT family N-acetyltransferase [Staphylococcus]|jgi:homospermidine synthase|uniref:GNAT family N-acetyltransferase n=1 Tax=Staphylococcus TaxID=1279 RepID=UPI000E083F32|nr:MULTISPECIES: GNAT family N-acetyltransferase [Staphylococcus]MCD8890687.1 GNAT family N-acetyltransferase [Staphylococcus nepalensis]MDR5648859.1 GNAT family N-acetyltransferase [Staphylococcus nepalensis]MDW8553501.1 GNAT family N-acetyltransferase [Staphylococcus nepalensis]RIO38696.1 GNAT family N-acetyltransferase [Staphylococcus nepalensis]WQL19634.1 GNAT family N-acetyltransferase [Staphylococcus nepalensis]
MSNIRYLSIDDLVDYKKLLLHGIHEDLDVFAWKLQNERCLAELNIEKLLTSDPNDKVVIGAFQESILIGSVTLIFNQTYSLAHKAVIENMCVMGDSHTFREQIANQLMKYVFQICNDKNIEILMTSLISNNISGKVFLSNLNFEVLALEKYARKYGEDYVDEHWLSYYFNGEEMRLFD